MQRKQVKWLPISTPAEDRSIFSGLTPSWCTCIYSMHVSFSLWTGRYHNIWTLLKTPTVFLTDASVGLFVWVLLWLQKWCLNSVYIHICSSVSSSPFLNVSIQRFLFVLKCKNEFIEELPHLFCTWRPAANQPKWSNMIHWCKV